MKKLSILLIGMLLVAGLAFGQEVTVEGEASLTFGLDLDQNTVGFENAGSASIELAWLSDTASSGTQGWISVSDWEISFESEDTLTVAGGDVEAGWVFEPVTITIYSAPDLAAGNAAGFVWFADKEANSKAKAQDEVKVALANKNVATAAVAATTEGEVSVISAADYAVEIADAAYDGYLDDAIGYDVDGDAVNDYYVYVAEVAVGAEDAVATTYGGLTAAIDLGVATLTLQVASDGSWKNSDNDFAVGAEVAAAFGPANVSAGVFAGPFDAMDLGFTAGVDFAVGPASVDIGFDYFVSDWDLSAGVGVEVAGISLDSLTYVWSEAAVIDLDQQIVLDASGVVEGLGFTETVQLQSLLGTLQWYSKTAVSYDLDGIKPYATFAIDDLSSIDVTAGVELTGFVENTVFTLEYAVKDVSSASKGAVTFDATISL